MLLGLYGDSGCGKSTVASMLSDEYTIFTFCTQVRKLVAKEFPNAPANYLEDDTYHIEPDKAWESSSGFHQSLLEVKKEDRQKAFSKSIEILDKLDGKIVIPDVRTQEEYHYLYFKPDTFMCRIYKENCCRKKSSMDGLLDNKHFDYHIENNGTLEDLETAVKYIR